MKLRYKVWLEKGSQPVLGDGLSMLLRNVSRLGSISQAAAEMRMSYRQAWGRIKRAEERMGFKLLEVKIGGEAGGGAELTPEGRELLEKYSRFRVELDDAIRRIFQRNFW